MALKMKHKVLDLVMKIYENWVGMYNPPLMKKQDKKSKHYYMILLVHLVLHPHGIVPTHFLKIRFVVAGGGFYFYYIHQGNKSDKERKL